MSAGRSGVSLGDDENLIAVMVAQLCEYTKNHFKNVNFMVCEFYLNF